MAAHIERTLSDERSPLVPHTPSQSLRPRLVALDMDGTLLTNEGKIPQRFWSVLARAHAAEMIITPASGRQLATLRTMFAEQAHGCRPETFIAENGAVVFHGGDIVSTTTMPEPPVRRLLHSVPHAPFRAHTVVCTPEVAYTVSDLPEQVDAEVAKYYAAREKVGALTQAPTSETIKIALYVESDAETDALPWVRETVPELRVLVSSTHWLDIMDPEADKGTALLALAETLGIAQAETAAIGDYLNDVMMLQSAGVAVAMGNAHADLKAIADEVIGDNDNEAAVTRLEQWLA